MKNPHIELVKKWLADPKSVSQEELDQAAFNADADADAADATEAAAWNAVDAALDGDIDDAKHWVKEYEELTQ
jgi:hypothetical protein